MIKTISMLGIAALSAVTFAAPAMAAGDPVKGKTVFARCAACHATVAGQNRLGPTLAGIVGSKAGVVPNFSFSPAMKASGVTWTAANLDKYLAAPKTFIPGNKMAFFGVPNADDRANLIAYLTTLK